MQIYILKFKYTYMPTLSLCIGMCSMEPLGVQKWQVTHSLSMLGCDTARGQFLKSN